MTGWDERYSKDGWAFGVDPNGFLRQEAHQIPLGRVLCLGEGEGRNAVFLAKEGFEVVGVDQSPVGMEKAQALAREEEVSIETVVSSIEEFDLQEGEWEGIVSIFFHLPPEARRRIHRAVVKGLKRKGVFILEAFTPKQFGRDTGGPPHADRMMTLEVLRGELEGLELVVARECERDVQEGRMHTGLASVVQVVGVRV
jgi:SAM-dependent methyltransferase